MRYLATLFANPEVELAAAELVAGDGGGAAAPAASVQDGLSVAADMGDAGALLDEEAKAAYRGRLEELRAALKQAESWSDPLANREPDDRMTPPGEAPDVPRLAAVVRHGQGGDYFFSRGSAHSRRWPAGELS